MSNYEPTNEGEGSRAGARRYNRGVKDFKDEGKVDEAANRAKILVEESPASHAVAEQAGRAPARGFDLSTPEARSTWQRVKDAIRRDWEQTKSDLSGNRAGVDLDQGVTDTVGQAAGSEAIPPKGEPVGVPRGDSWGTAESAVRFGYLAADTHPGQLWSPTVEEQLAQRWREADSPAAWPAVRAHVLFGWRYRQDDR